jgi:hypothetical protein
MVFVIIAVFIVKKNGKRMEWGKNSMNALTLPLYWCFACQDAESPN